MRLKKTVLRRRRRLIKKTNKLRYAEYYGMQPLLDALYCESKNGNNFYGLTKLMGKGENIRLAYRNIKRNTGSHTAGVDGKTIADLEKLTVDEVVSTVRGMFRWYEPGKVRRVFIPKPDGRKRPLGIPCMWDRLFQQCILQILEPICEAKFHPHSYGFRPNRSAHHAIARANHLMNNRGDGYHYCVDMDIKGFFDNVNHGKLLKQMWTMGIRDKKLLSIISTMLKAEIAGERVPDKGTPQGGILSPLLANIVLNELDWWISDQWETFEARKCYSRQGGARRALAKTSNLKKCYMVRYADDFKIFCKDYPTALKMFKATKDFIECRLKLEISPEKSKIVNLRKRNSEFLGFSMHVEKKGDKYVAYSHMTEKAKEKSLEKLKKAVKRIAKEQSGLAVRNYNVTVMGIQNYYRVATHVTKDLGRISQSMTKILYNRLRRDWQPASKNDLPTSLYERYKGYNPKWFQIDGVVLVPVYAQRNKYAIQFNRNICPYSAEGRSLIHEDIRVVSKEALKQVRDMYDVGESIEFNDNLISKFVAQGGKCGITGKPLSSENWSCHRIDPKQRVGRDRFSNLIIIVTPLHKAITEQDQGKVERLLKEYHVPKDKIQKCWKIYRASRLSK